MKMNLAKVTRTASMTLLKAKKNSPHIMFGVGIVGVGVGTVLACRATLNIQDKLDEHLGTLDQINSMKHSGYTEQDRVQDKTVVWIRIATDVSKAYGPAIIIGGLGVSCLAGSHNILTKRNAAVMAAYAALERSYNTYRERVAAEIGEDRERELHYVVAGIDLQKQTFVEDGVRKSSKEIKDHSPYARFFDEYSRNWTPIAEQNMFFLKCQQNYINDRLKVRGHVFLNEVYDMIGLDRSSAGAVVGWIYEGDEGDSYIDFGIFNPVTDAKRDFVNGAERSILLDFNVDGVIYNKI